MTDPTECFHLSVDILLEIHEEAIARFGGGRSVGAPALLASAVAAPQATSGGAAVFGDLLEVGAAYLFYVCRNHPFVDGNKRAALGACLVFLRLNGVEPPADGPAWEDLTLAVASGEIDREELTRRMRALFRKAK